MATYTPPAWPIGTGVIVKKDDGSDFRTVTRSEPWQLGDGQWVILVKGIAGGYAVERVRIEQVQA